MAKPFDVLTLSYGARSTRLFENQLHHLISMRDVPPLYAHALDDATFLVCRAVVAARSAHIHCVRADCCRPEQSRDRRSTLPDKMVIEAIYTYKFVAVMRHLRETRRPVLLLDADAMVISPACFDELAGFDEDIITQLGTQYNPCPAFAADRLGFHINLGVTLYRPTALPFLNAVWQIREFQMPPTCTKGWAGGCHKYLHHCHEQELLHVHLVRSQLEWRETLAVLQVTPPHQGGAGNPTPTTSVRLLDLLRWGHTFPEAELLNGVTMRVDARLDGRRNVSRDYRVQARCKRNGKGIRWSHWCRQPSDFCVIHPTGVKNKSQLFEERGLWYL